MEARDRNRFAIAHFYPVYIQANYLQYWVVIFSVLRPTLKSIVFTYIYTTNIANSVGYGSMLGDYINLLYTDACAFHLLTINPEPQGSHSVL